MIRDYFDISVNSLRRRKLRSWLTIIGIFIGMAAVVSLISLSQGMQNAIAEQFQKIGSDRITVTAGGANYGPAGASLTTGRLTDDDVKLIKKVSGVKSAMGVLAKTVR